MRSVRWNRFPIKNLWLIPCFFHLWSEVTWIQICASLNHRTKMKAEPSRLIPLKPIENVELFIVQVCWVSSSGKTFFVFLFLGTGWFFWTGQNWLFGEKPTPHLFVFSDEQRDAWMVIKKGYLVCAGRNNHTSMVGLLIL